MQLEMPKKMCDAKKFRKVLTDFRTTNKRNQVIKLD
jgi:hypothetical protein